MPQIWLLGFGIVTVVSVAMIAAALATPGDDPYL